MKPPPLTWLSFAWLVAVLIGAGAVIVSRSLLMRGQYAYFAFGAALLSPLFVLPAIRYLRRHE